MHLLFTDERSPKESEGVEFFIYGGLAVPAEAAWELHRAIENIRTEHGFGATDALVFVRTGLPDHVTKEVHTAAKKGVVAACEKAGAAFFASVCHHKIANSHGFAKTVEMGGELDLDALEGEDEELDFDALEGAEQLASPWCALPQVMESLRTGVAQGGQTTDICA